MRHTRDTGPAAAGPSKALPVVENSTTCERDSTGARVHPRAATPVRFRLILVADGNRGARHADTQHGPTPLRLEGSEPLRLEGSEPLYVLEVSGTLGELLESGMALRTIIPGGRV